MALQSYDVIALLLHNVHKATIAIAIAEPGRTGEVRYIGSFPIKPVSITNQLKHLAERYGGIECVYDAGPCAYTLYRKLIAAGIKCIVVVPSKLSSPKGRVKNDHRDAEWMKTRIGIGLEGSVEALQVGLRMFAAAIGREGEPDRGRNRIGAGTAIAYIGPEPSGLRSSVAWCAYRHGGIVGMKSGRGEHMSAHRFNQARPKRRPSRREWSGQGRHPRGHRSRTAG